MESIIVYHGTASADPLIPAGAHVSPLWSRSAKYARYPGNGNRISKGYLFRLRVRESEVDWQTRDDCHQGTLKKALIAEAYAICDFPITDERGSVVRIPLDDKWRWGDGTLIEWNPVTQSQRITLLIQR